MSTERAEEASRVAASELNEINRERRQYREEGARIEADQPPHHPTGVIGSIQEGTKSLIRAVKEATTGGRAHDTGGEGCYIAGDRDKDTHESIIDRTRETKDAAGNKMGEYKDYTGEKAKEGKDSSMSKVGEYKDYTADKAKQAKDTTVEKMGEYKDYAAAKAQQAKDATAEKAEQAKEKAGEYKDYAAEKAKQTKDATIGKMGEYKDYTADKAKQTKDATAQKAEEYKNYTAEKAKQTKDATAQKAEEYKNYTAEKAKQTKDATAQKAEEYKNYTAEKAKQTKDTAAEKAKQAKEKMGEYKDYTAEKGKEGNDSAAQKLSELKGSGEETGRRAMGTLSGKKEETKQKAAETGEATKEKMRETEEATRQKLEEMRLRGEEYKEGAGHNRAEEPERKGILTSIKEKLMGSGDEKEQRKEQTDYHNEGERVRIPLGAEVVVVEGLHERAHSPTKASAAIFKASDHMSGQTFNDVGDLGGEDTMRLRGEEYKEGAGHNRTEEPERKGILTSIKEKLMGPGDETEQRKEQTDYHNEGERVRIPLGAEVVVEGLHERAHSPTKASAVIFKASDQMSGQTFNDVGDLGGEDTAGGKDHLVASDEHISAFPC